MRTASPRRASARGEEVVRLEAAGVEVGTTLVALDDGPGGARARLRDPQGREREVAAEHVVAADGAYSTVRSCLGIPMRGSDDVLVAVSALVRAPLRDAVGEHRYGFYATDVAGEAGSFFPTGRGDRWLIGYLLEPGPEAPTLPTAMELEGRIRPAAGVEGLPMRIERMGSFSSSARIADRFRGERVFLIGDAADRVTPRGGTGMNTPIHDGYDLGWKLAWVLRGWAGPGLLDSYERERRPVAEHNVARSADPGGTRRPPGEELHVDLGGRIGHHWIAGADAGALDPRSARGRADAVHRAVRRRLGARRGRRRRRRAAGRSTPGRAHGARPRHSAGRRTARTTDGIPAESWSRAPVAGPALARAVADLTATTPAAAAA